MNKVRAILREAPAPSFEGRGRLDPTVREIAARTQVPIDAFTQCPYCGESMDNRFIHLDVVVDGIDFHWEACDRAGTTFADVQIKSEQNEAGGETSNQFME